MKRLALLIAAAATVVSVAGHADDSTPTPTPTPLPICIPICGGDVNGDGVVTVDEILYAVDNALNGCRE